MKSLLFSFEGRANRARFWLVNLAILVVEIVLFAIVGGEAVMSDDPAAAVDSMGMMGLVVLILFIPLVWAALGIAVKRWHDRNKSGWWLLITFVPVIGGLWYLIECGFLPGTPGPNKFGADPLGAV